METLGERVAFAREQKGWTQKQLAERVRRCNPALGTKQSTIHSLEEGSVERPRYLRELAIVLDVNENWLLTGEGPMLGQGSRIIQVMGKVCAGAHVEYFAQTAAPDTIELIDPSRLAALQVDGESMYPRFYPGEFILYDTQPAPIASLLNQYAVVHILNGPTMIKILREGRTPFLYTLESHRAPPMKDVDVFSANRYLGVIPSPDLLLPEKRKRR